MSDPRRLVITVRVGYNEKRKGYLRDCAEGETGKDGDFSESDETHRAVVIALHPELYRAGKIVERGRRRAGLSSSRGRLGSEGRRGKRRVSRREQVRTERTLGVYLCGKR